MNSVAGNGAGPDGGGRPLSPRVGVGAGRERRVGEGVKDAMPTVKACPSLSDAPVRGTNELRKGLKFGKGRRGAPLSQTLEAGACLSLTGVRALKVKGLRTVPDAEEGDGVLERASPIVSLLVSWEGAGFDGSPVVDSAMSAMGACPSLPNSPVPNSPAPNSPVSNPPVPNSPAPRGEGPETDPEAEEGDGASERAICAASPLLRREFAPEEGEGALERIQFGLEEVERSWSVGACEG